MNKNSILITGGSSGLGLEMAKQLLSLDNEVLICGRDEDRLLRAKEQLPELLIFKCDLASEDQCLGLVRHVQQNFSACNVLINNAAIVHRTDFFADEEMVGKARLELDVNLMAPIMLTKFLVPFMRQQASPVVVNITTGLIYAPKSTYPIYNASKAALHAFTQVLRDQATPLGLDVREVMFPVVDTPWHQGTVPKMAISAEAAVKEMLSALQKGRSEVKVGKVKLLHLVARLFPSLAIRIINKT